MPWLFPGGAGIESAVKPAASVTSPSYRGSMDDSIDDQAQRAKDRHDQLTRAPEATEEDAAPRIRVSEHDGIRRIDIDPDAPVRPGLGHTGLEDGPAAG